MPFLAPLISAGAGLAGSLISSGNSSHAVDQASQAQQQANQAAIAEQQREFNTNQSNIQPWLKAGQGALGAQEDLLGLGAPNYAAYVQNSPDLLAAFQANPMGQTMEQFGQNHWSSYGQNEGRSVTPSSAGQQGAIDQLKASPLYQSLFNTGKDTILQNAAATGGLRGGNTQNSLARFGSDTLAQVIQQQLGNLGGISGAGQNAAGTIGQLGANTSGNISNLLQQGGANQAGGILANANIQNGQIKNLTTGIGGLAGNSQITDALSKLFGGGAGSSTVYGNGAYGT